LKTYQAMFIFSSSLKEEVLEKALEHIKGDIAKLNGTVASSQVLGTRTFARPMNKRDGGLYVKMMISMDPKDMDSLAAKFRLNEDIFRVQVITEDKTKIIAVPAPNEG